MYVQGAIGSQRHFFKQSKISLSLKIKDIHMKLSGNVYCIFKIGFNN